MKILQLLLLWAGTATLAAAQPEKAQLQAVWEDTQQALEDRFSALDEYYTLNNLQYPDATRSSLDYHYRLAKATRQPLQMYQALKRRGNLHRLQGAYPAAMQAYLEADSLAKAAGDPLLQADIKGNIGNVYVYRKDYVLATRYFADALDIYQTIGHDEGRRRMLTSLGSVFLIIQSYPTALDYYQRVLKELKEKQIEDKSTGIVYINMGWAYHQLADPDKAKTCYYAGLDLLLQEKALFYVAATYTNLAILYRDLQQYPRAQQYAQKSADLNRQLGVSAEETEARLLLAEILATRDPAAALAAARSLQAAVEKQADPHLRQELYKILYNCHKRLGQAGPALAMHEIYTRCHDSIQAEKSHYNVLQEAFRKDVALQLANLNLQREQEKNALQIRQLKTILLLLTLFFLAISSLILYISRTEARNRQKRSELLAEIDRLKTAGRQELIIDPTAFELDRSQLEHSLGRKLNETDWKVLNILLEDPSASNRSIAEKACLSVDGIGSSLKRMYEYFAVKDTKYKKISLLLAAIQRSRGAG